MTTLHATSSSRRGFTLIETVIALALFSLVATVSVGGFARAFRIERQAKGFLAANSNINAVIEQIVREVRTGESFCDEGPCPSPTDLWFRTNEGVTIRYCYTTDILARGILQRGVDVSTSTPCSSLKPMTSRNVDVRLLRFTVVGQEPLSSGDKLPPRITVNLGISPAERTVNSTVYYIQSTIAPRIWN